MKWKGSLRGFVCGMVVGVVVAGIGTAVAGIPKKVWDTNGQPFQLGFLIGFYDAAAMARTSDPGGFFDRTYPTFENLSWYEYVAKVEEIWSKEEYGSADGARAIALAAIELQKDHETIDYLERFKTYWERRQANIKARLAAREQAKGKKKTSGAEGGDQEKSAVAGSEAPKKPAKRAEPAWNPEPSRTPEQRRALKRLREELRALRKSYRTEDKDTDEQ